MKESCTDEVCDESTSNVGQDNISDQLSETPQKPKSTTLYVPPAVDVSAVPVAPPEEHEDKEDDEDHEMQAEPTGTTGMGGPWSSSPR